MTNGENERMAVVETKLEAQKEALIDIQLKVDEMYIILQQIKGAKWLGWTLAAALGAIASHFNTIVHYLQGR